MSKHFFISQFAYDQDYQGIPEYQPEQWKETRVEYAGEIIVDVQNCEYEVSNGSGTYKPDPPGTFLREREQGAPSNELDQADSAFWTHGS